MKLYAVIGHLMVVITWYRPPDSTVDKFDVFESLVGRLDTLNVEFYIMGDINCNLGAPELDHNSRLLNDIANLFTLHQLIDEPTRVSLTSSTLIDLIFTNCSDRLSCSGVYPTTISDHSLVYPYRKRSTGVQSGNHSTVTYRRFKNFDPTKFRNDTFSQDWDRVKMFDNPNGMWHDWKNISLGIVDKHAPLRSKRARASKSLWIPPSLKQRMHERDTLKLNAIRSSDPVAWLNYKQCRNSVNNAIRQAKKSYYSKAFHDNEGNSRMTWLVINDLTSQKTNGPAIKEIKQNGTSICKITIFSHSI